MNDDNDRNTEGFPAGIFSQDEKAVRAYMEKTLKSENHWIRANALEAISIARCVELLDIVMACLHDGHAWVRGKAAEVLGTLRAKDAVPDIIKCLEDDDVMVRLSAVWALGEIGDRRALDILVEVRSGKHSRDGQVSYLQVSDLAEVVRKQLVMEAENSINKIRSSEDK